MKNDSIIPCPVCGSRVAKTILINDTKCVIGIEPEYVKEIINRLGKSSGRAELLQECFLRISKTIDEIIEGDE